MAWLDVVHQRFELFRKTYQADLSASAVFALCAVLLYGFIWGLVAIWAFDSPETPKTKDKQVPSCEPGRETKTRSRLFGLLGRGGAALALAIPATALYGVVRHAFGDGTHAVGGCLLGLLLVRFTLMPKHLTISRFNQARKVLSTLPFTKAILETDAEAEADSIAFKEQSEDEDRQWRDSRPSTAPEDETSGVPSSPLMDPGQKSTAEGTGSAPTNTQDARPSEGDSDHVISITSSSYPK